MKAINKLTKLQAVAKKVGKPLTDRVEGYSKLDDKVKKDMKHVALVGAGFIVGILFS